MLSDGVILLHDNARPHTARKTQKLLRKLSLELPPIQLRFGTCEYFLFPKLKEHLFGTRFSSDSDVKTSAENWINGQGCVFYRAGLNKLVMRSDKCLDRFGQYVGK
ncbi:hypothetical protein AVEN_94338-1 [Araneus ventricosus]|uniref:Histone-lysine N-methyltransferase SETMAR n=1 Tax=Araneus ventricosus TaxID=182803 RepID=A0A4Y2EC81_ARAVE|nr:hypothetical protein AVEN_94338-1 [Araneus ventricosus]